MRFNVPDVLLRKAGDNNLFNVNQYGFRRKHSCTLQLLNVLDDIMKFHDENNQIDMIYLDIQKAFDSVPHNRLIKKLESYGIQGDLLNWIETFLTNRKQRVIIKGMSSEWQEVTSGIP